MPLNVSDKRQGRRVCATIFCVVVIFLGTVWCGNGAISAYNLAFTTSTGQCQGTNTEPQQDEHTLTLALIEGPNITLCLLRADDGTLLRHFDLAIHGDIIGQKDDLLYINERGGTNGDSLALCAVQMNNGVTRWCQTQAKYIQSITTSADMVYALTRNTSSQTATFFAIKEATGQVIWHYQMAQDPQYMLTQTIAGPGLVYLSIYQPSPTGTPGTTMANSQTSDQADSTRRLCAFLANTGQQNWCHTFPGEYIEKLTMDENTVYVRTGDTRDSTNFFLYALNASTGNTNWHQSATGNSGHVFLATTQGVLVTNLYDGMQTADEKLMAWRTSDGHTLWQHSLHNGLASATVAGSHVYTVVNSASFQAFNIADGTVAWSNTSLDLPQNNSFQASSTLSGQTTAYMAVSSRNSSAMNVMAVRSKNGRLLWSDLGCNSFSTPLATSIATPGQPGMKTNRCYWHYQSNYPNISVQLLQVDA